MGNAQVSRTAGNSADKEITVMTYNILADDYVNLGKGYKYASDAVLDANHRRSCICRELNHFDPDIACLQEVEAPALDFFRQQIGHKYLMTETHSPFQDILVILFKRDKFELLAMEDIPLTFEEFKHLLKVIMTIFINFINDTLF